MDKDEKLSIKNVQDRHHSKRESLSPFGFLLTALAPCDRLGEYLLSRLKDVSIFIGIWKGGVDMGKGDRRTKRGKIFRGTYGKFRLKKKKKTTQQPAENTTE